MEKADTQSALESLKSIETVMNASHEIRYPWKMLLAYGVIVGLIPTIETATQHLTFGNEALAKSGVGIALAHMIFYYLLFKGAHRLVVRFTGAWRDQSSHPLILEGVRTKRLVFVSMIISMLGFSYLGHSEFIYPVSLLFFAVLFHIFAKFSPGPLVGLSWYSLILGSAYFILLKNSSADELWRGTTWLWSLGFIVTALALRTTEKQPTAGKSN